MPKPKAKAKLPKGMVSVAQAAELMKMTRQGVYATINRGELKAKRTDGRMLIARADITAHQKWLEELYNRPKVSEIHVSDEEFLRRMWDSDPDD